MQNSLARGLPPSLTHSLARGLPPSLPHSHTCTWPASLPHSLTHARTHSHVGCPPQVYSPLCHYGLNKPGTRLGVVGLGGLGHMAVKIGKAMVWACVGRQGGGEGSRWQGHGMGLCGEAGGVRV